MSDDNRIIIDAANFDRSMPKWASEETLSRLENIIKNSTKEQQRVYRDVLKVLKQVSTTESTIARDNKQSSDKTNKELEKVTKLLGQLNRSNSSAANQSATTNSAKSLDAISKEATKQTAVATSGFSDISKSNSKVISGILTLNKDLSSKLEEANKINERSEKLLTEMSKNMKTLSDTLGSRTNPSPNQGSGSGSGSATPPSNLSDSYQTNMMAGMDSVNKTLGYIHRSIKDNGLITQGLLTNSTSPEDLQKIIERQTRENNRSRRRSTGERSDSLRDMFERARRESGDGSGGMAAVVGGLAKSVGGLVKGLMRTPLIGGALAAAAAGATVVNKTFEYAYDVQKEFRDMQNRGFTFRVLGAETETESGESRLDGISVRAAITSNGVGLEAATKVLEHNTKLINNLGLGTTFKEIGDILGDANSPNSFAKSIGLTRDQVTVMAGEFYAIQSRISNISEDYTQLERQNLAKDFVTNVKSMSQTLGTSTDAIRQHIADFTKSDDFLVYSEYSEGSEQWVAFVNAMEGVPENIKKAAITTSMSPLGANDPLVQQLIGAGDSDGGNKLFYAMSELAQVFDQGRMDDASYHPEAWKVITSSLEHQMSDLSGKAGRDSSYAMASTHSRESYGWIAATLRADLQAQLDTAYRTPEETEDEVSNIAKQQTHLENLRQFLGVQAENVFAQAADTEAGREAILLLYDADEAIARTQLALTDMALDIVSLLDSGPIPQFLSQIRSGVRRVVDIISMFDIGSKTYDDTVTGEDASKLHEYLRGTMLTEDTFNKLFTITDNEDGTKTMDVNEDLDAKDITTLFTDAFSNAETQEERAAIAGLLRSLERGYDDGNISTSEELSRIIGESNESVRLHATSGRSTEERESLEDTFDGHTDSISKIFTKPLEEAQKAHILNTGGNMGNTPIWAGGYMTPGDFADLATIDAPEFEETQQLGLDLGPQIENLAAVKARDELTRSLTGDALREHVASLNQPTAPDTTPEPVETPPAPEPVTTPPPRQTSSSELEYLQQQFERQLEAASAQNKAEINALSSTYQSQLDSLMASNAALMFNVSMPDEEVEFDSDKSVEELVFTTNRLIRNTNALLENNSKSARTEQQELLRALDEQPDVNVDFDSLTLNVDDMIDINPLLAEISRGSNKIVDGLMDVYRVLGGKEFDQTPTSYGTGDPNHMVRSMSTEDMAQRMMDSLVRQESGGRQVDANGDPLTSSKGAVGIMQVMEATGREVAERYGIKWDQHLFETDKNYNSQLGELYLNEQLEKYNNDPVLAAMAYNSGPGNVDKMIDMYGNPSEGEITHEDFLATIKENHSGRAHSLGDETVPYATNIAMPIIEELRNQGIASRAATGQIVTQASMNTNTNATGGMIGAIEQQTRVLDHTNTILDNILNNFDSDAMIASDFMSNLEITNDSDLFSAFITGMDRNLTILGSINQHLGNIKDTMPNITGNIEEDESRIDTGIASSVENDTQNFLDLDELKNAFKSAMMEFDQDREQQAKERAKSQEPPEPMPYASNNANQPDQDLATTDIYGVLQSINTTTSEMVGSLDRNNRSLQELLNKII